MDTSIQDKIADRLRRHGRGKVFTPKDFLDLGGREAVDQALSRLAKTEISDDEMRTLMKEVVNKLYTALVKLDDEAFMAALLRSGARQTLRWDEPEIVPAFLVPK